MKKKSSKPKSLRKLVGAGIIMGGVLFAGANLLTSLTTEVNGTYLAIAYGIAGLIVLSGSALILVRSK